MPFTRGFRTRRLLEKHFDFHHEEVSARDEVNYEALADDFSGRLLTQEDTIYECRRQYFDNALVRWNYVTQEFGILSSDGFILTFFIADPRRHRFPGNRAYYNHECNRRS